MNNGLAMTIIKTVSDAVDAFGGTTVTSKIFGVLPSAVSNWRTDGRFPDRLHYRISKEAEQRGLKFDKALFEPFESTAA